MLFQNDRLSAINKHYPHIFLEDNQLEYRFYFYRYFLRSSGKESLLMPRWLFLVLPFLVFLPFLAGGKPESASQLLENHWWQHRVLVVLAPSETDALLKEQLALLNAERAGIAERDMVVYTAINGFALQRNDTMLPHIPAQRMFEALKSPADRFAVILIGKDGEVKSHHDTPVKPQELFRQIDAMPMRQQEKASTP
jgi:hypothetical protein